MLITTRYGCAADPHRVRCAGSKSGYELHGGSAVGPTRKLRLELKAVATTELASLICAFVN